MLVDWFTVVAQAINFLILVWLLKRFLYRPVLEAIDAREARIANELAQADALRVAAHTERDEFRRMKESFELDRTARLDEVTTAVKAERHRLLEEARHAVDALRAGKLQALSDEMRNLHRTIGERMQQEVFAVARRTLADLASTSLEERAVELFLRRLRALDGAAKDDFIAALRATSEPLRVSSAFVLADDLRAAIHQSIKDTFATEISLDFHTRPDLVCGIELVFGGQKMAWSIADYLASLERNLDELLQAEMQALTAAQLRPRVMIGDTSPQ